jgi:uncharacterized protein YjbI with pentapeptide repeats
VTQADCNRADFTKSKLMCAEFSYSNLAQTKLVDAILHGGDALAGGSGRCKSAKRQSVKCSVSVNFRGTDLTGVRFSALYSQMWT